VERSGLDDATHLSTDTQRAAGRAVTHDGNRERANLRDKGFIPADRVIPFPQPGRSKDEDVPSTTPAAPETGQPAREMTRTAPTGYQPQPPPHPGEHCWKHPVDTTKTNCRATGQVGGRFTPVAVRQTNCSGQGASEVKFFKVSTQFVNIERC